MQAMQKFRLTRKDDKIYYKYRCCKTVLTETADSVDSGTSDWLTCEDIGGVGKGRKCCHHECGTCGGGGKGTSDPCMNRNKDLQKEMGLWDGPFSRKNWGEKNCCARSVPERDCATHALLALANIQINVVPFSLRM